jgi:hypothetical protein
MPWWVSLYFTALSLILLWSAVSDIKEGRSRSLVAADLIGEAALIVVGLAYWTDRWPTHYPKYSFPFMDSQSSRLSSPDISMSVACFPILTCLEERTSGLRLLVLVSGHYCRFQLCTGVH